MLLVDLIYFNIQVHICTDTRTHTHTWTSTTTTRSIIGEWSQLQNIYSGLWGRQAAVRGQVSWQSGAVFSVVPLVLPWREDSEPLVGGGGGVGGRG